VGLNNKLDAAAMSTVDKIRKQLVANDLSGVVFVRDYLQLQFNPPPGFNVYSRCEVVTEGRRAAFGDPDFANMIIACVNKTVVDVQDDRDLHQFVISLAGDSEIVLHYADGAFAGPEAFEFHGANNLWDVWP
jgi:hypothetical protein